MTLLLLLALAFDVLLLALIESDIQSWEDIESGLTLRAARDGIPERMRRPQ